MDRRAFPASYRGAGVLLHVTSLPSRHGIGDLGPSAFAWIDRLHEAGQQFETAARELGGLPFIAEDLGLITPDVERLRDAFDLPGTRVLQFAFNDDAGNPHLPHNYPANAVVYTGTHDNPTTRGWYENLPEEERRLVWRYLGRPPGPSRDAVPALLSLAWASPAALAIAPFQDVLSLGSEARMNVPGRADGNWRWRCTPDTLRSAVFQHLRELTISARRSSDVGDPPLGPVA